MPAELFANLATTVITAGGTTAPPAGTTETLTAASPAGFPAANSGATPPTQFHIADTAPGKGGELIAVTSTSGGAWTATRGAEGTVPVAHASGWTAMLVVTAGALSGMLQAANNLADVASPPAARTSLGLGTAATQNLPLPVASGGTGQVTAAAALTALGGAAITGDLGGTPASPQVTGTHLAAALPVAQGGTGQATQQAAITALTGTQSAGKYLRSDGAAAALAAIQAGDLPSALAAQPSLAGVPLTLTPAVTITTTGATFSPSVTLAPGSTATVSWIYNGAVAAAGLTPTLSFGSAGTRTVRMIATDPAGFDALSQVTVFNIGYSSTNDPSPYSPSSAYNWTPTPVSAVTGITAMTGLILFLAENIPDLTGTLDFTGLSWLTNIELFLSNVTAVNTSGCTSLIRLDIEQNQVAQVELNRTAPYLYDFRAAAQKNGALTLTSLATPLVNQYHFCVRDQVVTAMPDFTTKLPVINQLWIWHTRQSGTLATSSTALTSVEAAQNYYTTASLANQLPAANSTTCDLDLNGNLLTSVTITGCTGLHTINLNGNSLNQAAVDSVLATVDGYATSGGTLNLGNNTAPSGTGLTHVTALQGRGWTVTVDSASYTTVQVVQTAHGSGLPLAFGSPVTAGNTVFLIAGAFTNSSAVISSSAPTLGGSSVAGAAALFSPAGTHGVNSPFNGGHGVYICAWMLPNIPGGATSLNLTMAGASAAGVIALEVSGLGASPAMERSASGSAAGGTAVASDYAANCALPNEIIIGAAQIYSGSGAGAPSPWTSIQANSNAWAGYRISQSAGGSFAWTQTATDGNNPWAAAVAAIS